MTRLLADKGVALCYILICFWSYSILLSFFLLIRAAFWVWDLLDYYLQVLIKISSISFLLSSEFILSESESDMVTGDEFIVFSLFLCGDGEGEGVGEMWIKRSSMVFYILYWALM